MSGASKILTVSYGTFSCTLEGFDDPFNTMKAIAEYFRDLASGDRYFGAEPPTPDAAMLHRIAEREIHARVEAKINENGVILRASDAAQTEVAHAGVTRSSPTLAAPALLDGDSPSPAESVAARLQRIRARHTAEAAQETDRESAVGASQHDAAPFVAAPGSADLAPDSYSEDEHAESLTADAVPGSDHDAGTQVPEAVSLIEVPDQIERILDDAEIDQDLDIFGDEVLLASFAADLPIDHSLDAHSADAEMRESGLAAAEFESDPLDMPEDRAVDDDFDSDFDDDALLMRLADGATEEAEIPVAPPVSASEEAEQDAALDPMLDDILPETTEDDDLPLAPLHAAEMDTLIDQPDQNPAPATRDIAETDDDDEPVVAARMPRARARVIRIRRPDVAGETPSADPVADPGMAEPPAATSTAAASSTAVAAATGTALSDEAEAALLAELAALEAEIEDSAAVAKAASATVMAAAEPRRHAAAPSGDDAVNRLMAHTNSEMDDEDIQRRQSAIAHLKAAVAATVAERKVSGLANSGSEARLEAYRSDLDRVVRPRRPSSDAPTPRPNENAQRSTPLVLVSAQRIDRTQTASAAASTLAAPRMVVPVRPRRVDPTADAPFGDRAPAGADRSVMPYSDQDDAEDGGDFTADESGNVFADATSFRDFAEQLGASALPDLLEAAAVYCAEVLQRPEFSRPLVMRQVAGLSGQSDTAREDCLRSFGTLLRQGRITKVKRGTFALTDRSPYLAEARKIAG